MAAESAGARLVHQSSKLGEPLPIYDKHYRSQCQIVLVAPILCSGHVPVSDLCRCRHRQVMSPVMGEHINVYH